MNANFSDETMRGMQLFSGKRLSHLTFDEIVAATTGVAEGFFVDYKADWPSKLFKTVASFANYHGGYVLIGIKEDSSTKLPQAYPGVATDCDLSERARNHLASHIQPFPVMEIGVVAVPGQEHKAIVIIRVPESANPPHICSDGRVYLRNLDASDPVDAIKHRHDLDLLYEKQRRLQDRMNERLRRTVTYTHVRPQREWAVPKATSGQDMVSCIIAYPSAMSFGPNVLLSDAETHETVLEASMGGMPRRVQGGRAIVSNADRNIIESAMWWTSENVVIAYEDGLLELVHRQKREECMHIQQVAVESVDRSLVLLKRLEGTGYMGRIKVELHLLGVWNVSFVDPARRVSNRCDHGVIKYEYEIDPVQRDAQGEGFRNKLVFAAIDYLMAEAGGKK